METINGKCKELNDSLIWIKSLSWGVLITVFSVTLLGLISL